MTVSEAATMEGDKRAAAEAALGEIRDGMLVGLGTGSTVAFLLEAIARERAAFPAAAFVATSQATRRAAVKLGIAIGDMALFDRLDLAIDGADEINRRFFAIKGGGGAMLREKVVAAAADRFVVIAEASKRVDAIGGAPVPVEVLPFARSFAAAALLRLGARVTLREREGRVYWTDNGHAVLDCRFPAIGDPRALAAAIDAIPGVLGHGLFLDEVDAVYIAEAGVVTRLERFEISG